LPPTIPEVNLSEIELDQKILKVLSRIKWFHLDNY
jgi:hypothetical protein